MRDLNMKKLILSSILGAALCIGSAHAEIVVRVRPPALRIEHRTVRPGPRYVWVGGYHRWYGGAYEWVPGRWTVPPRHYAVWVAPHWYHRHDGYVFVAGRWR
jgi:hypothetical protein